MTTVTKQKGLDCYDSNRVFNGVRQKTDPAAAAAFVLRAKKSAESARKLAKVEKNPTK